MIRPSSLSKGKRGPEKKICVVNGCGQDRTVYGRCLKHFRIFKEQEPSEYQRLSRMSRAERESEIDGRVTSKMTPVLPRWEWLGDEETLAARYGNK